MLRYILRALRAIQKGETIMADILDQDIQAVTDQTTVIQSAITLITGLTAKLAAAGTDPVKLQALHDSLTANTTGLANAIAANTPAAPTTPV